MLNLGQAQLCSRRLRCGLTAMAVLAAGTATPALAQAIGQLAPPPVRVTTDQNGVDVVRGAYYPPVQTVVSIGPGAHHGLSLDRIGAPGGINSLLSAIEMVNGQVVVTIGTHSDSFTQSGSTYIATEGNGATLVNASGTYIYTARDGTEARFAGNAGFAYPFYEGDFGRPGSIKYPDGTLVTITLKTQTYCPAGYDGNNPCNGPLYYVSRVQSVTNSNGYQLKPVYASNATKLDDVKYPDWRTITDVIAINNQVEACSPSADTCTLTGNWPRQSTSTTPSLRVTTTPDANGRVGTAVNHGISYTYAYADVGSTRTTTVTGPTGSKVWVGDTTTFLIASVKDELNRTTSYNYDASGRLTQMTSPEGNAVQYAYDARGNVTTTTAIAKAGSGLANIATTASYPASCTNPKTCNKPDWTRNAKGNQTDYSYDATHGGVLTVTAPAAATGGVRPQVRYGYTLTGGMYLLTGVSTCQTTASCAGALDEIKSTIGYGTAAQNYLPISVSTGAGDNSLTASASLTYDTIGNRLTIDGPLAGTADMTRTVYDNQRRVIGVIGPDPDGAGPLKNRAQRVAYNADWQVTTAEVGTTIGQTDTAFAAFAPLQQLVSAYDANAFKISDTLQAGGTTYALTHYNYDSKGRSYCTATRMDPAQWSSQTDACMPQVTGPNGADRIIRQTYYADDSVMLTQTAYNTAEWANEVYRTYSGNNQLVSLTDALNNQTIYEYDGFDRLLKTRFPISTQGAQVSSTTDYDGLTYDANNNVTQRRLRDGLLVNFTYDNLNRVTLKDVPATGAYFEQDIDYLYDLLGRVTRARGDGWTVNAYVYDALGRVTTEQTYNTATYHAYDIAGRETRTTWAADANYVDYNYLVTGEVSAIRENGAASGLGVLGSYTYNDLGQTTTLTRGNGTVTSYAYDPVARLASLTHDLGGTANDVSTSFTYNPASQIASSTRNNDVYKWNGHYNVDRSYSVNGLNQLTTAGATALGYDGRGNLTSSGSSTYGYTSENRLAQSASTNSYFAYEPGGGQLLQVYNSGSGSDTRFGWSGGHMIMEISASASWAIARRYVYGPGADSPLVWYEGTGLTDRRWLIPDERGSIVAVTDASGAAIAVNSYDEYGIPAATNLGRFGYTGQAWLPELGMYYYKARIYSPTLGRFMQSDPIGYGSGMNMYGYVGGDPVNWSDPLGLCEAGTRGADNCILPVGPDIVVSCDATCRAWNRLQDFIGELALDSFRDRFLTGVGFIGDSGFGGDDGAGPTDTKKEITCIALSYLGQTGRIRLGVDAAGGFGGLLRGGFGLSIRGDGSLEVDAYFGGGLGGGAVAGAGIGIDNGGSTARGGQLIGSNEFSMSGGYGPGGGGFSIPNKLGPLPGLGSNGSAVVSGGFSAGPKLGLAGGQSVTGTASYRTGPTCK